MLFLLLLLLAPSFASTVDVATCQEALFRQVVDQYGHAPLSHRLAISGAKAVLDSIGYNLKASQEGATLAEKIDFRELLVGFAEHRTIQAGERIDYYRYFDSAIRARFELSEPEGRILSKSMSMSQSYIAPKDVPVLGVFGPERPVSISSDVVVMPGYSPEARRIDVSALQWHGVDEYVTTRLGPVVTALDALSDDDEVVFSNLGIEASLMLLGGYDTVEHIHLPISSYGKNIWLVTHSGGQRSLLFTDMVGHHYLVHNELLVKRYFHSRGKNPLIYVFESEKANDEKFLSLKEFFLSERESLGRVDVLVFGYAPAFGQQWAPYAKGTVGRGAHSWWADLYEIPNGKRVAVISTHESLHGEILSRQMENLLDAVPSIKTVFVSGSAGSLVPKQPYALSFPSRVGAAENILSTGSDDTSHISVISPLEETPEFLFKARSANVTSVDMEFEYVANVTKAKGVKLGAALMITDFPDNTALYRHVSLAFKEGAKTVQQRKLYADAVFNSLMHGTKMGVTDIEDLTGRALVEVSAQNIARYRAKLAPFNADEELLMERIRNELPLEFTVRISEKRLEHFLEDGFFLSTKRVAELVQRPQSLVKPTTPILEEQLFGGLAEVFGTVGPSNGNPRYGNVVLKVKEHVWKGRSWASLFSGWHAGQRASKRLGREILNEDAVIADPSDLEVAREELLFMSFVPRDYLEAIALRNIQYLRKLEPAVFSQILSAREDEFVRLLAQHGFTELEGKVHGGLHRDDVIVFQNPAPSRSQQ